MSDKVVIAEQVSVRKKKKTLLDDISFSIESGTICGLLGPSGAGKTTLMRVIMGIQIASSGKAEVLGFTPGSTAARRLVGYVTQSPAIYDDLTVTQNLRYFARLVRANTSSVKSVISSVHLEPKQNQLVSTLSGGEKTRVSLAIALLGDPQLLVLDEPTVGLDPLLREDLWQLFRDMAKTSKTLLVSSHVMSEAEHCQQLLLLREAKLLWHDSPQALLHSTKASSVEKAFIQLMKKGKD